jgi:hypothetical protein
MGGKFVAFKSGPQICLLARAYPLMTAQDVILEIESLSADERNKFEAWMLEQQELREDAIDLAIIKERKNEPTRDIRAVLSELGIQSE